MGEELITQDNKQGRAHARTQEQPKAASCGAFGATQECNTIMPTTQEAHVGILFWGRGRGGWAGQGIEWGLLACIGGDCCSKARLRGGREARVGEPKAGCAVTYRSSPSLLKKSRRKGAGVGRNWFTPLFATLRRC